MLTLLKDFASSVFKPLIHSLNDGYFQAYISTYNCRELIHVDRLAMNSSIALFLSQGNNMFRITPLCNTYPINE